MDELDDAFDVLLQTFLSSLDTEERVVDVDRRHIRTIVHDGPAHRALDAYEFIILLLDFIRGLYAQEPPPQHAVDTFAYRYPFAEILALACTHRVQQIGARRRR